MWHTLMLTIFINGSCTDSLMFSLRFSHSRIKSSKASNTFVLNSNIEVLEIAFFSLVISASSTGSYLKETSFFINLSIESQDEKSLNPKTPSCSMFKGMLQSFACSRIIDKTRFPIFAMANSSGCAATSSFWIS